MYALPCACRVRAQWRCGASEVGGRNLKADLASRPTPANDRSPMSWLSALGTKFLHASDSSPATRPFFVSALRLAHQGWQTHDPNVSSTNKLQVEFLSEFLKAPLLLILVIG